ncbi:glycosyl hydrolase catalytic core-domain-containing protein [Dioszegia hungarica]|uniref:Glycosyl hydrolase catalytic core-domain-containing protein n=1 Tax=Dioszegia hungarica TaxID=4972 RepID=A0AA38HCF3_9TREE|nr:glycosyl hydrolase catalytic core-domain-containing protein [Dioszegia hungarica]KAI9637835.1 glycosyl hydrolase catalytic core-domain-containing protein [Dioszegia hungarica]
MIPAIVLAKVLPALALVGLALTGLENVPAAAAHSPSRRGHSHQHLAIRAAVQQNTGAQEKKRVVIRRRANGTQCRVRGGALSPSANTSSAAAAPSSAAPAASSAAAPVVAQEIQAQPQVASSAAPSPAAPTQNNQNWAAASSAAAAPAPAAASPSPAAKNNSPAYSGSSGGAWGGWTNVHSKLGNAWPNGDWAGKDQPDYVGNYIGSKASWYYTWSPHAVGSADSLGLEFVPMLWGPHQVSDWWSQQASWPKTVKNALFFNEPNEHSQCNMAAGDSISYWMNDFLPLRSKGVRLGGAATTSAPSGLVWSQDFEKLCVQYGNSKADCTPDFVPIHWYDVTPQNFQAYVENYHKGVGHNLWVTEYACQNFNGGAQCSDGETWALHQQMSNWFDQQDYIERYAPFGVMKQMQGVNQYNALMNPDGSITSLGNWYIWSS